MEKLLDFSDPIDVNLLDKIVACLYSGSPQERDAAQQIMTKFQQHPDAWLRADAILEKSSNMSSKYFALQVLEGVIKYRWKVLPREQCDGIKNYIVNLVIKLSSDASTLQRERIFINKLNLILVQASLVFLKNNKNKNNKNKTNKNQKKKKKKIQKLQKSI